MSRVGRARSQVPAIISDTNSLYAAKTQLEDVDEWVPPETFYVQFMEASFITYQLLHLTM